MKRRVRVLAIASALSLLCGCSRGFLPYAREISNLKLISVLGLDLEGVSPEKFVLTASAKKEEPVIGSSDSGDMPFLLKKDGKTLKEAALSMQSATDKYISFGHVEYYVLGENAALNDLTPFLDFLARDSSTRYSTRLYLVMGDSANTLLSEGSSNKAFLSDRLESLDNDGGAVRVASPRTLAQVLNQLEESDCALIPALTLVPSSEGDGSGNSPPKSSGKKSDAEQSDDSKESNEESSEGKTLDFFGYAAMDGERVVFWLDKELSAGVNLMNNDVSTGVLNVLSPKGYPVALKLSNADVDVKCEFDGDRLKKLKFTARISSNISESHDPEDVTDEKAMNFMSDMQGNIIKKRLEAVIEKSRETRLDFLWLSRNISMSHPGKWQKLRHSWPEALAGADIEIEVTSNIGRSYDVNDPMRK